MDTQGDRRAGDGLRGRPGRACRPRSTPGSARRSAACRRRRSPSRSAWSRCSGSRSSSGEGFGQLGEVGGLSWYYLIGGLLGAVYVTTVLITVRTLGAGGVTAATIAGQLTMSVVLDRLGILGLAQRGLTPGRRDRRRAAGAGRVPGRFAADASRHSALEECSWRCVTILRSRSQPPALPRRSGLPVSAGPWPRPSLLARAAAQSSPREVARADDRGRAMLVVRCCVTHEWRRAGSATSGS